MQSNLTPGERIMTRRILAPRALAVIVAGVAAVGLSPRVQGQEQPAPAKVIERIEVTGSLVSKIAGEAPLPVTTITATDIAKTWPGVDRGWITVEVRPVIEMG